MSDESQNALFAMPEPAAPKSVAYRVLARKYRPTNFSELIGQEALVRTLTNAFASGRIAHAFILTGVRGVGKTTTARIIAKGLNCVEGPTVTPCEKCEICISINQGRNVDIFEQDAASNRRIDDIRFLTEGSKYAPTTARYKVFILDEFHMLTTEAFNALLKILEEPPPHVKFILATTDIQKVPVTILSRCQRFDLRRIEPDVLMEHFRMVTKAEGVEVDDEALRFLARTADGSARDGLSLLDRAIALGNNQVTGDQMREMLGLADRSLILDLLTQALSGQASGALEILSRLHRDGADALIVLQDLLDSVHQLSRAKVLPEGKLDPTLTVADQKRLADLAATLSAPALTRSWQVLLKGIAEVQAAPQPMAALEMLIIRLAYIGMLPSPADLIKRLEEAPAGLGGGSALRGGSAPIGGGTSAIQAAVGSSYGQVRTDPLQQPQAFLGSWRDVVTLVANARELQLNAQLFAMVECVSMVQGHLEIFLREGALPNVAPRLARVLNERTGQRWMVTLAQHSAGKRTLAEEEDFAADAVLREAAEHPTVKAILLHFPNAKLDAVRDCVAEVAPAIEEDEAANASADLLSTLMNDESEDL